jgi:uncharacterized protein YbjT (DUF2867 family)
MSTGTVMILVMGATGKTGRELVKILAAMGVQVRAAVRDRAKAADMAALGVEVALADLSKPETLAPVLEGVEKAYLLSAPDPQQVILHSNFIVAARKARIKHIVRQSVRWADDASPVKICRWHAASQKELEDSGIAWTHLQPVYNMQNFLKFVPSIQSQGSFYAPMKDGALSMVDARDVAAVAARTLTGTGHEGSSYVVTGPEALTFTEAAAQLSTALAKPIHYVNVDPAAARNLMLKTGMPEWYVDDLLGFYALYSTGAGAAVSDAVAKITGTRGRTFREFAEDFRAVILDSSLHPVLAT